MSVMPEGEEGWRAYYEHPLTAATTAMLNINGTEEQAPTMALMYEFYKTSADSATTPTLTIKQQQLAAATLPEIWTSSVPVTSPSTQAPVSPAKPSSPARQVLQEAELFLVQSTPTVKHEPDETDPTKVDLGDAEVPKSTTELRKLQVVTVDGVSSPEAEVPAPSVPISVVVQVKQESPNRTGDKSPATVELITGDVVDPKSPYSPVFATVQPAQPYSDLFGVLTSGSGQFVTTSPNARPVYTVPASEYYRDYYTSDQYQTVRQHLAVYQDGNDTGFVDRYIRQNGTSGYKTNLHGLTVDLPSPDSGIGEATMTPRESTGLPQIFDYSDLSQAQILSPEHTNGTSNGNSRPGSSQSMRRSWHEYGRSSDTDKIQIPKIQSDVGFKYYLESPISTSQRREDDRITYINKGQFYGITLEYVPDPDKPLKSQLVKSLVMLVFREEKSPEDEIKAWQFWHSRQHSVKQRILDAGTMHYTKNSSGIVGQIEEITHNAIAFYWNPLESPAKVNVAVQCLSTDFSNQKGVKGLPLHLQIDTYDEYRENCQPVHRGYCQIKVFCDKGAERKTRDEERRAAKRKLSATGNMQFVDGRKKIEEMYHPPCDRSEFYSMSDLIKPPVLFTPSEDTDKVNVSGMELGFYANHVIVPEEQASPGKIKFQPDESATTALATTDWPGIFQASRGERRDKLEPCANTEVPVTQPPLKKMKIFPNDRELKQEALLSQINNHSTCSTNNGFLPSVLLYARREKEEVFHALHLVPPSLTGLMAAIENKYKIDAGSIKNIFKRCKKGITVQMDDDIVKHYCNEDTFIIEIDKADEDMYDITLVEL